MQPDTSYYATIRSSTYRNQTPIDTSHRCSIFETVILAEELLCSGSIDSLTFYYNYLTNITDKHIKIWLGETTAENLMNWIPSSQLNLVFDGLIDLPAGIKSLRIRLDFPYIYQGNNLVMLILRETDANSYNPLDKFYCLPGNHTMSRFLASNDISYDPANPPAEYSYQQYAPKTTFHFRGEHQNAVISGNITSSAAGNFPVAGACVYAAGRHVTSNADGQFILNTSTSSNPQRIIVTAEGFSPLEYPELFDSAGDTLLLHPVLNPIGYQTIWEGFDTYPDFSNDFSPWHTYQGEYNNTVISEDVYFPTQGTPQGFIIFNPFIYSPFLGLGCLPRSGDKLLACFSDLEPGNDDWAMSPLYNVHSGRNILRLWIRSALPENGLASFQVGFSDGSLGLYSFHYLSPDEFAPAEWTLYEYTVPADFGRDIRVGIKCTSTEGIALLIDNLEIFNTETEVDDEVSAQTTQLRGCYPNPFTGKTLISFSLKAAAKVNLEIYNLKGQKVKTLVCGQTAKGTNSQAWDGKDEKGNKVSGGVYLIRLKAGKHAFSKKVVLL